MPFLARFINDWATEDLVKQFMKNRRENHYRKGWLDVPEKYAHLKANAQKRNQGASRTKKALVPAGSARNAAGPSTQSQVQRGRAGKHGTRIAVVDSDEDDYDDAYGGSQEGASAGGRRDEDVELDEWARINMCLFRFGSVILVPRCLKGSLLALLRLHAHSYVTSHGFI
jgi:hypothetical protein